MPELPEVETVRRDLCRHVCGRTIARVRMLREDMLIAGGPSEVEQAIEGAAITDVGRRGKALILRFSSSYSLIVHFRMTGKLYPLATGAKLPAHARTVFEFDDGGRLVHEDVRRLGTLELIPSEGENCALTLTNIGPDIFEEPPSAEELADALERRKCAVKPFLLDQTRMSGIGNIYACEILARACIRPDTPCDALGASHVTRLLASTREVLVEAIQARGTTISDYRTGTGGPGGFQHQLRVYGRADEPCLVDGCDGTIRRIVQGQRSTYFCPVCQKRARRRRRR